MTDRPIAFAAPMVRALLEGRKTQTRRVLPEKYRGILRPAHSVSNGPSGPMAHEYDRSWPVLTPWQIGDRLWVREAWRTNVMWDHLAPSALTEVSRQSGRVSVLFVAGGALPNSVGAEDAGRYRHARFMPRWASRLTLTVTDVRVERLQDISEADAEAEGCFRGTATGRVFNNAAEMRVGGPQWRNARNWYADLWDHINGPGAWDANPWIVALTFTVRKGNIDG